MSSVLRDCVRARTGPPEPEGDAQKFICQAYLNRLHDDLEFVEAALQARPQIA
jgi:hypothetical protein